ncbi:NAD(P)/FAD-dependent oxidoreductase [Pseudochrobactrum sp. HB0163]|uniref:NAD(P)/FAD-dependent oxidoreductase n=1 Tax=Pseudochrobactrum sp. HB0163 TaxID=3450708 RepID=UPI003F6E322A
MQHDAIIVGGSFAGLSAAIYIARARRSVCVIDAGSPRNRFAEASHGFFGQDGNAPLTMIAKARAQLQAYPTSRIVMGEAHTARAVDGGFEVTLTDNTVLTAARLVLAFGISDILPDLPGLAERWGKSVLHCPYCHGFEYANRRLGVLSTMPMSLHQALFIPEWGETTLFLNGASAADADMQAKLVQRGVTIEPKRIIALQGEGTELSSVLLEDGRSILIDALYLAPRSHLNSPIAEQLGCALDEGPFGAVIRTDAAKLTSVAGVYAAGDIARVPHNASWASADGVTAGMSLHQSLAFAT